MSTRYYDLPGIAGVTVDAVDTVPGDVRVAIHPDREHPDWPGLGPLTIVGQLDDCLRLLLAWARAKDEQAAHRSGGVIRVSSRHPDSHPAISEYGDLTTVGALRRGEAP